ncbi:MAG: hypothetical protein RQ751_06220 [Longimicrobiales bacterium]|nr:hypothetical protein [Longimicrobiales bacterium]
MRILRTGSLTLLFAALGVAPALAQHSSGTDAARTLSHSALDSALVGHESVVDQQRAKLGALLSGSEARSVAEDRGIDMGRVESAAAGLSDAQVNAVSPLVSAIAAAQDNGGLGTVTISVAVLIVALLVLILIT